MSKDYYPYLVKDADVGVACLSIKNKTPFVPGKFLGYMAATKPVLAFLNEESDGFALASEARCGYAVKSDDSEEAARVVKKMYAEKDKLFQFGQNGFAYAKNNMALSVFV